MKKGKEMSHRLVNGVLGGKNHHRVCTTSWIRIQSVHLRIHRCRGKLHDKSITIGGIGRIGCLKKLSNLDVICLSSFVFDSGTM
jgi:hypothetical protein